jgi:hypothetical protein
VVKLVNTAMSEAGKGHCRLYLRMQVACLAFDSWDTVFPAAQKAAVQNMLGTRHAKACAFSKSIVQTMCSSAIH